MTAGREREAAARAPGGGPLLTVESAFRTTAGAPRFEMLIPEALLHDPGVYTLECHETEFGGYERATRAFLDERLMPGDAFVDVGAHFGVFSLSAATLHPGRIAVLAVEPHPLNLRELKRNLAHNRLAGDVEVVAAAASDVDRPGHLARGTTMGHSLFPTYSPGSTRVRRATLDALLEEHPRLRGRRTWMKIDVEGHELQVIRGAPGLLRSGGVAGIVWEMRRGGAAGRAETAAVADALALHGFRHYRLESDAAVRRLRPFDFPDTPCNVISLREGGLVSVGASRTTGGASAPRSGEPELAVVEGRHGTLVCHRFDMIVGRSLRRYGEFSELELELLRSFIRPGETVVDVGANVGSHALAFSERVGTGGRVHAFEAHPRNHELLVANVERNRRENVVVHGVALGAGEGTVSLPEMAFGVPGNFGGVELRAAPSARPVRCIALDSVGPLPGLSLVKIDVEGMELEVLRGARERIAEHRPTLYVENDRRDRSRALIAHLLGLDYAVYWHTPPLFNPGNHAGERRNFFGRLCSVNLLCLPRERRDEAPGLRRVESPSESL